jgi:capsular polysaccharide biosynthesis protein
MDSATVAWVASAIRQRIGLVVLVLLLVLAADAAITWKSPREYLARTSLLIGPNSTVDPGQLVYSVDALGRSMIVGTYANVLETDVIRRDALQQVGVDADPSDPSDAEISIKAAPLADSAVVQVIAVAPDPDMAAAIANAVGQAGQARMRSLYPMYDLTVVTQATPPTGVYRPDVKRNLSLGVLAGLLASASAACAMHWWKSGRTG